MADASKAGEARQKKTAKPVKKPALLKTSPNRDLTEDGKPGLPENPEAFRCQSVPRIASLRFRFDRKPQKSYVAPVFSPVFAAGITF